MTNHAEKETAAFRPRLALFSAALIWGSSFVMMKNAVSVFPVNVLLTGRFSLACLLLSLVFFRRLKLIDRDYLKTRRLESYWRPVEKARWLVEWHKARGEELESGRMRQEVKRLAKAAYEATGVKPEMREAWGDGRGSGEGDTGPENIRVLGDEGLPGAV